MSSSFGYWLGMALALLAAGARAETASLRLQDGSVVRGEIIGSTDSTVTIRNAGMGEITVRRREIIEDASVPSSSIDPSDQALFFMPTAFLPPAKAFTFRDFELLFITFGYSPGARTAISGGFLFPVTPALQVVTAGLKQNLWSDGSSAALSITGNLTKPIADSPDDVGLFANSNLVASKRFAGSDGREFFGIHGAIGYLGHRERYTKYRGTAGEESDAWKWQGDFDYGIGCDAVLTPHAKFLFEYVSAAPLNADNSFKGGLLTLGFRLHGERLAADIAGLRPFTGDHMDELILWPLLVVSYRI